MTIDEAKEVLAGAQKDLDGLPARREGLISQIGYLQGFIDSQENPDKVKIVRPGEGEEDGSTSDS